MARKKIEKPSIRQYTKSVGEKGGRAIKGKRAVLAMADGGADVVSSNMKFVQACPPPLDDGDYRISVTQSVSASPKGAIAPKLKEFSVRGPRFALTTADVYSLFPPANQTGAYANCLPHIVLNRKTLPWERDMDNHPVTRAAACANADQQPLTVLPWVALLVFSTQEAPEVNNRVAKDVLKPRDVAIMGPSFQLDTKIGESDATPCLTIDVEKDLFLKIAPSLEELPYLAHARYVDASEHKPTNTGNDSGYFSVVVANRFPLAAAQAQVNTVHLVSLEGLGQYLPGGTKSIPDTITHVRLISLAHWCFSAQAAQYDFVKLVDQMSHATVLRVAVNQKVSGSGADQVTTALNLGYTALGHNTLVGEKTVSWYRGPLVPVPVQQQSAQVYTCSDALLKYDPGIGMFDVSYAAAWQLGSLLALQNKNFAVTLFNWRRQNHQQAALTCMRQVLQSNAGSSSVLSDTRCHAVGDKLLRSSMLAYWKDYLGPKLTHEVKGKVLLGRKGDHWGVKNSRTKYPGVLREEDLLKMNKVTVLPN